MSKKNEFDCTGITDRTAVNDFLAHTVRGLRQRAFKLVSERSPSGAFTITITGDGSAPGEVEPLPTQTRKRAIRTGTSEEPTTTTECCGPE